MIKSELLKLRKLRPTTKMMNMAMNDVPTMRPTLYYSNKNSYIYVYKYDLYIRAQNLKGILKIAFFKTEDMRRNITKPICELFINIVGKEFITYDCRSKNWSSAKISNLPFSLYQVYSKNKIYTNSEANKSIKKYLQVSHGGIEGIIEYQNRIREEDLIKRHKKETDPWDEDLEQTPSFPKDWEKWAAKVGITENFIFYKYAKDVISGYCSYCEKQVPILNPRHNKFGKCKCCNHKIQFKSLGKAGHINTSREYMYLIQKCKDGFMIREFEGYRHYYKGKYENPENRVYEIRRTIFDNSLMARAYFYGMYKQRDTRWIKTNPCSLYYGSAQIGKVYGKTIPSLSKDLLSRTGLSQLIKDIEKIDPEFYLIHLKDKPYLERLAKAGLTYLANEITHSYLSEKTIIAKTGELHKMLGIDKHLLKILRKINGGSLLLKWLAYLKERNKPVSEDVIKWFEHERIEPKEITFIIDRMSEKQVCNYLKKIMNDSKETGKSLLNTWQDYLIMAKRLNINVYDEIVYKPKKLIQRHNELVKRCGSSDNAKKAYEISNKFPNVETVLKSIKAKYDYQSKKYSIIVPEKIEDILIEGDTLNHCVNKTTDRYFERIDNRESYILFLRKSDELEKPFYTLEIEPDGTSRQIRSEFNRQGKDIHEIKEFILKWQKIISKNLTQDDFLLSEKSNEARLKDYKMLRKEKVTIRNGDYNGKLLADVLEADLLLNRRSV